MATLERPEQIVYLAPADLCPRLDQPRQFFDGDSLAELAQDLAANGVRCPLAVRLLGNGKHEVLAGHRRLRAALLAHLSEVPCVVYQLDDAQAEEFVVFDNLNRTDLLPWEEGAGFRDLTAKHGLSPAAIGQKIGKSEAYILGRIALAAGTGEKAQEAYRAQQVTLGTLQLLAALPNRVLHTRECPQCRSLSNSEQPSVCRDCFADLSGVILQSGGNPQSAALALVRGKTPAAAAEIIGHVKGNYGLQEATGQTALDLGTLLTAPEAVKAHHRVQDMMSAVGRLGEWIAEHGPDLRQLPGHQREAIRQQAEAAIGVIRQVSAATQ
jgi:ParB/RepB/Spo0J family partition protein